MNKTMKKLLTVGFISSLLVTTMCSCDDYQHLRLKRATKEIKNPNSIEIIYSNQFSSNENLNIITRFKDNRTGEEFLLVSRDTAQDTAVSVIKVKDVNKKINQNLKIKLIIMILILKMVNYKLILVDNKIYNTLILSKEVYK